MRIERATNDTCAIATGAVVAIDVIRAFTTAAFALAAGARDIVPVGTVEQALALRERFPGSLAMGEVDGRPIEGFDFGNSPSALLGHDLSGRRLIQRTSAGTQGLVRSLKADTLLAGSFVCAGATARYLQRQAAGSITLVATGIFPGRDGDEDIACADYLAALLRGERIDTAALVRRVRASGAGQLFVDPDDPVFPAADLECCTDIDRFDFAMLVQRRDGMLVMEAVREPARKDN
jgi:2-phosphosulfolactate phosphatase